MEWKRRRPGRHRIPGVLLLAVDTSTPTVTAGVLSLLRPHQIDAAGDRAGAARMVELLSERTVTGSFAHAEHLMPLIMEAVTEAGCRLAELEAIVVGLGPGPFTGLRVGIATAQALGDALDIPVHGVGSHDATARADLGTDGHPPAGEFLVVTDARRREVYLSAYTSAGRRLFGPKPVAPGAVPETLAEHSLTPGRMIGAGTSLLADLAPHPVAGREAAHLSVGLVLAAARSLVTGVVPGPLAPLYLRRPDATQPGTPKSVLGR